MDINGLIFKNKAILIKEWKNVQEILKENKCYKKKQLFNCLTEKHKTAYGFIWKYIDENIKQKFKFYKNEFFINIGILEEYDFSMYEISNYGKIKTLHRDRFMKPSLGKDKEYYVVGLHDKNTSKQIEWKIHQLVAYLFVNGNLYTNKVVNHKDKK
ncbi:Hypothetical protein KVN_LOCUS297 [uncultured virus]|nr:Hypothetical protein KVN_LOCUS297 [uncultured virus]